MTSPSPAPFLDCLGGSETPFFLLVTGLLEPWSPLDRFPVDVRVLSAAELLLPPLANTLLLELLRDIFGARSPVEGASALVSLLLDDRGDI